MNHHHAYSLQSQHQYYFSQQEAREWRINLLFKHHAGIIVAELKKVLYFLKYQNKGMF